MRAPERRKTSAGTSAIGSVVTSRGNTASAVGMWPGGHAATRADPRRHAAFIAYEVSSKKPVQTSSAGRKAFQNAVAWSLT